MKKISHFIYAGAAVFFLLAAAYIFRAVWLPAVAQKLIVNEKPVKSNVIIVLNGHNVKMRLDHAVALYKNQWAPKILLSGSWELEKETSLHVGQVYARSLGVPEEDLLIEKESRTTYENALFVKLILEQNNFKSFILVTSPAHTFRTRLIFKRLMPEEIQWRISTDPSSLNARSWWKTVEGGREILYEYLTLFFFLVGGGKSHG